MDRVQPPDSVQWVDVGMHQHGHQYPPPISSPHQQDFSTYGFVESPGFPAPGSPFRLQPVPVPIAPNYLGLSQWGQSMPQGTQGTAPSHQHYSGPPAIAPAPAPTSAPVAQLVAAPAHTTTSTSSPRRTLTDDDRRRMCMYHEDNPNVKQTEIGAMFGVERSTVSKVLRQKEKYLFPDDGNRSPVKRSKGKFPDIERALSVWARNTCKQGVALTDQLIREKARFFASCVGVSDSQFKANGAGWLEKFKQKNNLHPNGRGRSESDATGLSRGSTAETASTLRSPHHTRTGSTPANSQMRDEDGDSQMMQQSKSQDGQYSGMNSPESFMDLSTGYKTYTHQHSGPVSPSTSYYSPENGMDSAQPSPAFPSQQARMHSGHPVQQRPRSQTFPLIEYISPPASSEPLTPKIISHTMVPPPALASPVPDASNPLVSPRNTPSSSHTILSGHGTPEMSSSASPSRDDARKALETFMSFLKQQPAGFVEPDDFMLVDRLLGKFELDGEPLEGSETHADFHGSMNS